MTMRRQSRLLGNKTCPDCGHESEITVQTDGFARWMDGGMEECGDCRQFFCNRAIDGDNDNWQDCYMEHRAIQHAPQCSVGMSRNTAEPRCKGRVMSAVTVSSNLHKGGARRSTRFCSEHRHRISERDWDLRTLMEPAEVALR